MDDLWWGAAICLAVCMCGCGDDSTSPDSGGDDAGCASACDDGEFCNGVERCLDLSCQPGIPPCSGLCDEVLDECNDECVDRDGDGALDSACGGNDCDDTNAGRYPGNTEICDVDDVDEDCDPRTFGVRDLDGDGFADAACCNDDGGTPNCGDDCEDSRASQHPSEAESCDGLDNDCDGTVDEEVIPTWYEDADSDGYGDADGETVVGCDRPSGFADNPDDCDDVRSSRNPGLGESCVPEPGGGPIDEDCDGTVDEDCSCVAGETRACMELGRCAAGIEDCVDGTYGECSIDPIDELCNGIDDDCDGTIDNGVTVECYTDADDDGFALNASVMDICPVPGRDAVGGCPVGFTNDASSLDCRDDDDTVYPGAPELCDRLDNDCSTGGGAVPEEDQDGDGYTASAFPGCTGGFPKTDCHDDDSSINPDHVDFEAVPYCITGSPCQCTNDAWKCVAVCEPAMASCFGADPASFDYDCNGMAEPMPGADCSAGSMCGGGIGGRRCPIAPANTPGEAWRDPANCGTAVPEATCVCDTGSCSLELASSADPADWFDLECR